jgi:hypothetical protein
VEKGLFHSGTVPEFFPILRRGRSWPCRKGAVFPAFFEERRFFAQCAIAHFRGFLGVEKRPPRRCLVFSKKTRFFSPSFCRGASSAFCNDYLIARHLMASHLRRRCRARRAGQALAMPHRRRTRPLGRDGAVGWASPTEIKHARAICRKEHKERREIATCLSLRYSRPSRDSRLKIFVSNDFYREMPKFSEIGSI